MGPAAATAGRPVSIFVRAVAWIVVLAVVIAWRLGYVPLLDPDEAHYASITREMRAANEWVVPLLDGMPHIDKPVLFHWLQGVTFGVLGESELAARLPSAAAALALLAVTWWMGHRLFGPEVGERAALMLATTPATFALSSIGVFDMLFTAFLFGGVALLAVGAIERRRLVEYAGYGALGLAVLTKGPVALVLVGATFAVCLALPLTRPVASRLQWVRGLALALAVSMPWFLWMWWRFGDRFVEGYLLYGNLWLFTRPLYRQRLDLLFYLRTFVFAFMPWSLLAAGHATDVLRSRSRALGPVEALLWIWTVLVIGFFSFSRFKLDTYIYPAAPAVCLLSALAWQRLREAKGVPVIGARAALAAVPIVLLVLGIVAWRFLFDLDLPVSRAAAALPVVLIGGALLFGWRLWRDRWTPRRYGAPLLGTLVATYALIVWLGFPVLEAARPTPRIARWLVARMAPEDRVAIYGLGKWRASLRFYTNRPMPELDTPGEVLNFFGRPGRAYVIMRQRDAQQLLHLDARLQIVYDRRAVVGSEKGRLLRRQRWAKIVVVTRP